MSEASELIAQQILNASVNKKNWGQVLYNVKVFGAQGDGVYDDTQAVQDAIDTAIFNDATLVYFPPGEYAVTDLSNTETINFVGDNASFVGYGGVIVQLGSSASDIVLNVKDYEATGDGTTDDTESIQEVITLAAVSGGTVFFPPGTYVTDGQTVPNNVTLLFANGAALSINTGEVVAIGGSINAGLHQIFTGLGTVTGFSRVVELYPQWWGAVGNSGATNSTAAFQKAIAACPEGGKIVVVAAEPSSYYYINGTLTINKTLTFSGTGSSDDQNGGGFGARLVFFENSYNTAIDVTASGVTMENISMYFAGTPIANGIRADSMLNLTFNRLWVRNFQTCYLFNNCLDSTFIQCNARDCNFGFRFEGSPGGTSINLMQCWVMNPAITGYQFINHNYCTMTNCLMDSAGPYADHHTKLFTCLDINLYGCAGESTNKSMYYVESSSEVLFSGCESVGGNQPTSYSASFAYINVASDNITFINCKDYLPLGTNPSVNNATTSSPVMVSCDFPNKYGELGTIATVQKNSVNIGLASFNKDGVTVLSPDGSRKKIVVSNANAITASTVTG